MLERLGHLRREPDGTGQVERPLLGDEIAEVRAIDELEDDVMPAGIGAHRIHPADVLMVEPGSELGLVLETAEHVDIGRLLAGEHLDGHDPVERRVQRPEHRPHPPTTDEALEHIGPEGMPLERGRFPPSTWRRSGVPGSRRRSR